MKRRVQRSAVPASDQRGVVLILALIMVVAMTMAGIALYRQVGTGLIVARNLAFKKAAVSAADAGVEAARTWIVNTGTNASTAGQLLTVQSVGVAAFYYPAWCYSATVQNDIDNNPINCSNTLAVADFDPVVYDWDNAIALADDAAENQIRYVIHRLCGLPGGINIADTPNQRCASVGVVPTGSPQTGATYNKGPLPLVPAPYYRVTVRVLDAIRTQAFTQVIIY